MNRDTIKKLKENGFSEEQIEFIKEEVCKSILSANNYKVKCGVPVLIYRQVYGEYVYYKIPVRKKGKDGNTLNGYKSVRFINCEPPDADKCMIIIHSLFEDYWYKSNDKFNAIFTIVVTDYEYYQNEERIKFEAIGDYYDEKNIDDDHFVLSNPVNEVDDFDLPF